MASERKRRACVALFAILLDEECEEAERKKKRSCWVRPLFLKRDILSVYQTFISTNLRDDAAYFSRWLRVECGMFDFLIEKVTPVIQKQDTYARMGISPSERLAITLLYLATGNSFHFLSVLFCTSDNTISKIVRETYRALYTTLKDEHLKTPNTLEEWNGVSKRFMELWQFSFCIGALDGKHVDIHSPFSSASEYFSYKKKFSIVLLALVDADYKFMYADVGSSGRCSDGGIWRRSTLRQAIEENKLSIPKKNSLVGVNQEFNSVIVGDEAFPLSEYLMRPYPGRNLSKEERVFNYRLSRARRVSENAFGILVHTFQIYRQPMRMQPEYVKDVVLASLVLHNYIRSQRSIETPNLFDREVQKGIVIPGSWRSIGPAVGLQEIGRIGSNMTSKPARRVRQELKEFFSGPGKLHWQDNFV